MLKTDLKGTFLFLKAHGRILGIVTLILFVAGMAGYNAYVNEPQLQQALKELINNAYGGLADAKGLELSKGILFNNVKASTLEVLFGIIPFFFIPGFNIATNGFLTGAVIASASESTGTDPLTLFVSGILPHGIFELPALIISCSLGIILCLEVSKKMTGKSKMQMADLLNEIARCFILLVIPLLIVAAFVETYVTPFILG